MKSPLALVVACMLGACQASAGGGAPTGASTDVTLYRYAGSRQCTDGGMSPEDARRMLAGAGVQVVEATCGADGRMHASVCGNADGRIVIVTVPARDAQAARSRGFAPLGELPEAVRIPCR
jgi:hypothetical protein